MAFDAERHQVVLFGGVGGPGFLSDTWTWDGKSWTERHPAHSPPGRQMAGLTWDASLRKLVLFGGIAGGGLALNDTWEWDGNDWSAVYPLHCPSPRAPSAIAYDENTHRVVVFGTYMPSTGSSVHDTWLWNGSDWTQLGGPEPAAHAGSMQTIGMAWDPVAKAVVLIDFAEGVSFWYLGGGGWGPMNHVQIGMFGFSNMAAYDPDRHLWIFYGSQSAVESSAVAVFDGVHLNGRRVGLHPEANIDGIASTYDPDLKAIVIFGGNGLQGPTDEFWSWDFIEFSRL